MEQLQVDVKNMLLAVEESKLELAKLKNEGNQVLVDIKSECLKLNKELMGFRPLDGSSSNSMGLMENRTIRDVLEEISMQVKMFSLDGEGGGYSGRVSMFPAREESVVDLKFGKGQSIGEEIRSLTDAEEQTILWKEVDDIVSTMPKLVDGMSSKGKTASSVAASIVSAYSCVVEIANFLDADLGELQYTWLPGCAPEMPQVIKAGTREVLAMSNPSNWVNGMFSYRIEKFNLRLLLEVVHSSNQLLFALAPSTLPLCPNAFQFEGGQKFWGTMMDKRWIDWAASSGQREMVIRNRQIRARVKFTGGLKSIIQVEIVRQTEDQEQDVVGGSSTESKIRTRVLDGQTIVGKKITRIAEYVLGSYGYVVEIINLLQVPLNAPSCYLENSQQPFLLPGMVSSGTREVVIIKMDYSGAGRGGLATFRIGTADLRLAVFFKLFNSGNKFGVAFVQENHVTDANLMLFLSSENQWKTSEDQKCGQSKDGELVIQSRNIRAMVSMTNGMKAVLKVVIKAF